MISHKSIILAAPLKEDTRNELFQSFETLGKDKQIEIIDLCWSLISSEFQAKLGLERQKMLMEMASQEKNYTSEEFDKAEESIMNELFEKLEASGNEEKIEEVRKQLDMHAEEQNTDQNISQNIPVEPTNSDNNPTSLQ
jgi:hypothetical protein